VSESEKIEIIIIITDKLIELLFFSIEQNIIYEMKLSFSSPHLLIDDWNRKWLEIVEFTLAIVEQ
jgi:hypothetical protein